jgi:hypothetical protein
MSNFLKSLHFINVFLHKEKKNMEKHPVNKYRQELNLGIVDINDEHSNKVNYQCINYQQKQTNEL